MKLTLDQVLAWRMRRQFLAEPDASSAAEVAGRLCGIQAQVASSAEHAVAARRASPRRGEVAQALASRQLVRTWAMRGTLHVLTADSAAAYLALLAASRSWERNAWQKTFATAAQIAAITDTAREALHGQVLSREELTAEIVRRTGDSSLAVRLGSGWGALLKPVSWQGGLIHAPTSGNRVAFTSPQTWLDGWRGLPDPDEAAARVIPAYLSAHGPASKETFGQWLSRSASPMSSLRRWFGALEAAGEVIRVEVDGAPAYARPADAGEIAAAAPSTQVRLLPAFDQYVLGRGTRDTQIIPAARRSEVSRAAGWISPVVVAGGRVAGTWQAAGGALDVTLFAEAGEVPAAAIEAEAARIGDYLGTALSVSVRTI